MKTIIIHHVQEMWNEGLKKYNTSFPEIIENIYRHLHTVKYDRVIVTNFEAEFELEKSQSILTEFNPEVYDYMYGWELDEVSSWGDREYGIDYIDGGTHSEVVLIDEWMHQLEGDIDICGAFDGECIEDLEIALTGAEKEFNRLENLIV